MRLHLVRHALPVLTAGVDPAHWPLSPEGRVAARALRERLPERARLVSSAEPKARETATAAAGRAPVVDARFGEVVRPLEPIAPASLAGRRAWVGGRLDHRHDGWERPEHAAARFEAAVADHSGTELVVVTHGMVMTAWLVARGEIPAGEDAARFWDRLALPDLVTLDHPRTPVGVPRRRSSRTP